MLKSFPKGRYLLQRSLRRVKVLSRRNRARGVIANRRKREKKSSVFLLFFFLFFNFFFVFVSCAFFFSRLLVEFCLEASRQTPKWKSVLREFLYVRLLYSITSFWTCDDDYDDYDVCKVPSSYRQLGGRGQLLSRRYCTHSGRLFSCEQRTAISFQGALAVSRKYFKQSK